MNFPAELGMGLSDSAMLLTLLIDVSLKVSATLLAIGLIGLALRRASASLRSTLWTSALAMVVILPAFSWFMPAWEIPLLPDIGDTIRSKPAAASEDKALILKLRDAGSLSLDEEGREEVRKFLQSEIASQTARDPQPHWSELVFAAWLAGIGLFLGWFAIVRLISFLLFRRSPPVEAGEWKRILEEARRELGIKRRVRLLESEVLQTAVASGLFRPAILVPASAADWPVERKRLVLLHELAHIKRLDSVFDFFAKAAVVLHWFNPLVWRAVRKHRIERERASDDVVLARGAKPSEYATQLLQVAADVGSSPRPVWQVLVVSQACSLKDRLLCILDPKVKRNAEKRPVFVFLILVMLTIILPLSAFRIWAPSKPEVLGAQPSSVEKSARKRVLAGIFSDDSQPGKVPIKFKAFAKDISSKDEAVSSKAADKLKSMDRELFIEFLSAALAYPDTKVRSNVIDTLYARDSRRVSNLLQRLWYGYEKMRPVIEKELQRLKGRDTIPDFINQIGYELLQREKKANLSDILEAIEVFKLNIIAFPEYSNGYDSLAEAYMKLGKSDLAVEYYRKALEMDPANDNAMTMLKSMKKLESGS